MFRLFFLSFIALRVIACPVCCAGDGEYADGAGFEIGSLHSELHSDCCSKHDGEPCGEGDETPANSPCPCEGVCECQVAPETNQTVEVNAQWTLELAPFNADTLDLSKTLVVRFEEQPRRLDLPTGRSVRLAHASLLF